MTYLVEGLSKKSGVWKPVALAANADLRKLLTFLNARKSTYMSDYRVKPLTAPFITPIQGN